MIKPLQLPQTLRLATREDLTGNFPLPKLEEIENANIIEGYKLHHKDDNPENLNLPFNFFSEINIDSSRLWDLFIALSADLPEEVSLIFGHIDSEPTYGKYVNKKDLIRFLSQYRKELTQDTFMFFGLIFNDDNKLIEVFIDESKYIKYWGTDEITFRNHLFKFNVKEISDLNFIDEFPKVRESLNQFDEEALSTVELINLLRTEFE